MQALYDTYTSGRYFKSRSDHFKSNFKSAMRRYVLPASGEHTVGAVQDWQIEQIVNDLIDADKEGMARGRLTHCKVLFRAGKRTDLCADIKPE